MSECSGDRPVGYEHEEHNYRTFMTKIMRKELKKRFMNKKIKKVSKNSIEYYFILFLKSAI